MKHRTLGLTLAGLVFSTALVALPSHASATVPATAPAASYPGLATAGTITFGTNFGYPPMEMYTGSNADTPTGVDVEIGEQIATRLHLKYSFFNVTDFSAIVPGLLSHRWDIILSSLNVDPDRAKRVNFIEYMISGQSILVRKGNPEHIMGLSDLSGKSVAVQFSTVEADTVAAQNKTLASKHKPLIKLSTFKEDTTAIAALAQGRFSAVLDDSPVALYNVKERPNLFQIAGSAFGTAPYGMAFRKSDTKFQADVNHVFRAMRADGTYKRILRKYGLTSAAL